MTLPKYLSQPDDVRKVSIRRETKVTRQIASGATWSNKGDISSEECLIEHKYTKARSFSLNSSTVEKIFSEAVKVGKIPKMIIEFLDKSGKPIIAFDAVIVKGER